MVLTRALQSWSAAEGKPSWSLCQAWSNLLAVCWGGRCVVASKPLLEWHCLQESLSGLGLKGKYTCASSTICRNLLTHSVCPQISQLLTSLWNVRKLDRAPIFTNGEQKIPFTSNISPHEEHKMGSRFLAVLGCQTSRNQHVLCFYVARGHLYNVHLLKRAWCLLTLRSGSFEWGMGFQEVMMFLKDGLQ